MRIRPSSFCLCFAIAGAICAGADAQIDYPSPMASRTNVFSLGPDDIRDEAGSEQAHYIQYYLHHFPAPETLQADLDTNGNWGAITNGFQLSLRFRKNHYVIGETIPAVGILRNVQGHSQSLLLTNSPSIFLKFVVFYGTNALLQIPNESEKLPSIVYTDGSAMPSPPKGLLEWTFEAKSEKEVAIDLKRFYSLTNSGTYTAKAICGVYSPTTKSVLYEVESGTASFSLVKATNSASGVH
jgi:hypothetical protein